MNSDTNTPWQYTPGAAGGSEGSDGRPGQNTSNSAQPSKNVTWTAAEYIEHARGAGWYLLLLLGTAGLSAGTYFFTKDKFAIGTIIVVGIIVAVFAGRKPRQVSYEVSSSGLKIGEKTYRYNLFKSFSVANEGAMTSINLMPLKRFMPPVSAYFVPQEEKRIVEVLGEHLPYEEHKLDSIDRLSRRLRL